MRIWVDDEIAVVHTHDIGSLDVSTCKTSVFCTVFVSRTIPGEIRPLLP